MPQFYKIDKERRIVLTTGSGVYTRADAQAHMEKLVRDPDFDPGYSQIADFTQVTEAKLSVGDIRELAQRSIFSPESRRAFIASNDLTFGLGRMFEMLRENEGEMGIRVFRTLEEALDWVLCKDMSS